MSEAVLAKFEKLAKYSSNTSVYIVKMHGLPGSGKSTLCKYLCDCLFSHFSGRALHLDLPNNPSDEELIIKAKQLLTRLTDFHKKLDLTHISDLRQIYHLLKSAGFCKTRMFLIVDNITSRESANFVQNLLQLGLGVGSGVLLVARTVDVLHPCLPHYVDNPHVQKRHTYVFDSMRVPSLSEREALRVLLQSGDGVGLPDTYEPESLLTQAQRKLAEEVVVMCAKTTGKHVPLVLKILGEQLRDAGLARWTAEMNSFWEEAWLCKEKAVGRQLLRSFRELPSNHKALFLDIALFILPLFYEVDVSLTLRQACVYLSLIHGCTPLQIEFELKELQKRCFVKIWEYSYGDKSSLSIHDVYLEFAASIEEASIYYWSSGHRWRKVQCPQAIEQVESLGLRTVVYEKLEEEELEFSSNLATVRAMVIRNCKDLTTLKGLGNLKLLASLEVHGCPSLRWVELPTPSCLRRLSWVNKERLLGGQQLYTLERRNMMHVGGLALQMRGLRELRLENTGIKELAFTSSCWQQLRVLEVNETHIKHLSICNLPNLEEFQFLGGYGWEGYDSLFGCRKDWEGLYDSLFECCETWDYASFFHCHGHSTWCRTRPLIGKDFLVECPKLQKVLLNGAACWDPTNYMGATRIGGPALKMFVLNEFCSNLFGLTVYQGSQFQEFVFVNGAQFTCLDVHCIAGHANLRMLELSNCPNVATATGLGKLSSLRELRIFGCGKLTEVSGLDRLSCLRWLLIANCGSLKTVSGLTGLASLEIFDVGRDCPNLEVVAFHQLTDSAQLKKMRFCPSLASLDGAQFSMRNFVNLVCLQLHCCNLRVLTDIEGLKCLKDLSFLCDKSGIGCHACSTNTSAMIDLATLLGVDEMSSQLSTSLGSLESLILQGLRNLRSLNGIEFLARSLSYLRLYDLQSLSSLHGIECLTRLENLVVKKCASVEELPCVEELTSLEDVHFSGLRMEVLLLWVANQDHMKKRDVVIRNACMDALRYDRFFPGQFTLQRMIEMASVLDRIIDLEQQRHSRHGESLRRLHQLAVSKYRQKPLDIKLLIIEAFEFYEFLKWLLSLYRIMIM